MRQAIGGNIMTASPISDLNPILMVARCTLTLASSHGKWDKFFAVLDIKALPKEMPSTPLQLPVGDLRSLAVIETEWQYFVEMMALIFLSKNALRD